MMLAGSSKWAFDINGRIIDTMLIASILDENRFSYSLNAIAYDVLGKVKSEKGLTEAARSFGLDPKAEMFKMPAMYVGPYAEGDAELTLELWNYFQVELGKEDLWQIANLELDLLPCLVDMTWRGVRIDQDKVERTRNALFEKEKQVLKKIKDLVGSDVEIWAAASIAKAFDQLSIPYPRTEKGSPSFTKLFLTDHTHELPQLIVEARNLNKTSGTFINTIMKHCHADGRIHSHKPNPLRRWRDRVWPDQHEQSEFTANPCAGPGTWTLIRSLFLPEEDEQWAAIDFATGTADLGPLRARIWQKPQPRTERRKRICRRLPRKPRHGFSYNGGRDGRDWSQASQGNKFGHDVRDGREQTVGTVGHTG